MTQISVPEALDIQSYEEINLLKLKVHEITLY